MAEDLAHEERGSSGPAVNFPATLSGIGAAFMILASFAFLMPAIADPCDEYGSVPEKMAAYCSTPFFDRPSAYGGPPPTRGTLFVLGICFFFPGIFALAAGISIQAKKPKEGDKP